MAVVLRASLLTCATAMRMYSIQPAYVRKRIILCTCGLMHHHHTYICLYIYTATPRLPACVCIIRTWWRTTVFWLKIHTMLWHCEHDNSYGFYSVRTCATSFSSCIHASKLHVCAHRTYTRTHPCTQTQAHHSLCPHDHDGYTAYNTCWSPGRWLTGKILLVSCPYLIVSLIFTFNGDVTRTS